MPNANIPTSIMQAPVSIGASLTNQVLSSKEGRITAGGSKYLRLDALVGKVTVAAAVTLGFQHSSGYNIWSTTKTVAVTASTNTSVTAVAATNILTATSHGFTQGAPIVFTVGTLLPAPLVPNQVYYADVIDANTFYVRTAQGSRVDITAAGTGSNTVTACRVFSLTFMPEVAGDQAYIPLKSSGRAVATTGAGDALQVLDILLLVEE